MAGLEVKISRYEEAVGKPIPDDSKSAGFISGLPRYIRAFINVNTDCPETYD